MRKHVVRATLSVAFVSLVTRPLFAQDTAAGEPAFVKPAPSPLPAASDTSNNLLGFIERLPASAYPNDPIRGIPGGSLMLTTMQGLQWPYYPKTGIGVSGYGWIDTGYETISRGTPSEQGIKYLVQQGRVLLRVTPTWTSGNYFVQAQAELVANKDQSVPLSAANADDVWLKVGRWNSWDVQFGRYEAWEIYHFGMGLDLYTLEREGATDSNYQVPSIYGVNFAFYRPDALGEGALHLYPAKWLRFEMGTQFGNEYGKNALAARPVGILDLGALKVKVGGEYKKSDPQTDGAKEDLVQRGFGGSIQGIWNPYLEGGVNAAYGLVDHTNSDGSVDEKGSYTTYSMGAFANARVIEDLVVGGGVDYTYLEDLHYDSSLHRVEKFDQTQAFGAVQYCLFKQLYIKAVGAYALGRFNPNFSAPLFNNEMVSGRVRLLYFF